MTSRNQRREPTPCRHPGAIIDTQLGQVRQAVQSGEDLIFTGACTTCGSRVELRYTLVAALPALAATMLEANSPGAVVGAEDLILEPWMNQENGIPDQLFMVHADIIRDGACGLSGMNFVGVNRGTKGFRYRCSCDFEWEVCAADLQQATVLGLHRSLASRRLCAE